MNLCRSKAEDAAVAAAEVIDEDGDVQMRRNARLYEVAFHNETYGCDPSHAEVLLDWGQDKGVVVPAKRKSGLSVSENNCLSQD